MARYNTSNLASTSPVEIYELKICEAGIPAHTFVRALDSSDTVCPKCAARRPDEIPSVAADSATRRIIPGGKGRRVAR